MGNERQQVDTRSAKQSGIAVRKGKKRDSIQITFFYKGVRCRETLKLPANKSNLAYAYRLHAEIENVIERGTFVYTDYFPNSKRAKIFGYVVIKKTLGELLRASLKLYEQAVSKGKMSMSTYIGYKKIILGKLIPEFDKTMLAELSPGMLREWISGLGLTAKATRNILTPLRSVLDDAVIDGAIPINPLDQVVLRKVLAKTAKKSDYEPDPFQQNEIKALLDVATPQEQNAIGMWFETGVRPGEFIALSWPKIDWINHKARIDENRVSKVLKGPKTAAGIRDIDLTPRALNCLQSQKQFTFLKGEQIFINPRTNQPWETDDQVRKTWWQHLLKRAGVRYRSLYQIRHTYAAVLVSNGVNLWWLAQQMGHTDIEMIIRTYGAYIDDNVKGLKLNRFGQTATNLPQLNVMDLQLNVNK